ncbi:MAG TPA: NADH-quinone oxidoreductase subunit N [Planctomycetota bacterium]|nr:NADH-quinone oxidoreductase subunit N [Planctomycetota bacterium]
MSPLALLQDGSLRATFDALFAGPWALATAPIAALGVGVCLLIVADIVAALRPAKPLVFAGSVFVAFLYLVQQLGAEPGVVLAGSYLADRTTALWGILFLAATLLAWVYSLGYYRSPSEQPFKGEHDVLMLTTPIGMLLMVGAQDLVVFFVGLELLSIPLYALAAFQRARATSVEAGIKYFLLGTFATGFLLYGSALVYAGEGTVSLIELRAQGITSPLALAGVGLIAASVFFKVSVFPFHLWVPDVYQGSPTPVTALMATGTKAAAFGFLVGVSFLLPTEAALLVGIVGLLTMAAGNLGALLQDDLKRLLAYSGVSHAGTLLLVVAATLATGDGSLQADAMDAALYYMGAYVFAATGAFGLIALLEADGERFTKLESLKGLARTRPGAAAALALFMLSLGGIPATGGFLGKWFVFSVLVNAGLKSGSTAMIVVAVIGALLSVVALGYYLRVIVALYMQPAPEGEPAPATERPLTAGIATVVCAAFTLLLGVLPGVFLALL